MVGDKIFKALSDKNRRKIIELLREKEMTAGDIASHFDLSKPTISEHLKTLKKADIIYSEKDGNFVRYYLNTTILQDVVSFFMDIVNKSR